MNTIVNNTSNINKEDLRIKVGKLINTDLNLIHSKLKIPLADIDNKLWDNKIKDSTLSQCHVIKDYYFTRFCIFKCF